MNYINKFEEINVDINLIFKLINNVENYHKFLPWCSDSKVLSDVKNTMLAEIEISKNFINWKFKTENNYKKNKIIELRLKDGPFSHLEGYWKFELLNEHNTSVQLYLEYEFDNKLVELSIKPIFSGIMSSILDSFISEAFRLKNNG
ncbi:MAG: Persistence and stress-resistance toxin PasT [Gammaproteobacteria bacterium]|nr:MAG: Persistence and stress-resistance toxin PasT [Gammaproteobacteria bacterium]|tara:strand:- start:5476 stop:5913 length:438 start_codon:yes stop_codon:yes gene_type:complete